LMCIFEHAGRVTEAGDKFFSRNFIITFVNSIFPEICLLVLQGFFSVRFTFLNMLGEEHKVGTVS
jgi:hypothetical protein